MHSGKLISRVLYAGVLLCCLSAVAQQPISSPGSRAGAEGRLTVTATVVSSVGLVMGPDGEQRMIVANAADPRDNVSRLQPVVIVHLTPVPDTSENRKLPTARKKKPADQR
jgi:hypothetical protein